MITTDKIIGLIALVILAIGIIIASIICRKIK